MEASVKKIRININSEEAEKRLAALAGTAKDCQKAVRGAARTVTDMSKSLLSLAMQGNESNVAVRAIKQSIQGLGNAVAAAFQPIVTAAVPLLATLCDWLATAANYIAKFFAALGGGNSYKKAVAGQNKYNRSLKSGGGAAKKFVNNLSGLDEIHLWQSPTGGSGGGGGGGGSGLEGLEFEDVLFDGDKVRALLKDILWYAGAIAAALLTWKIARAFGASLTKAFGLALAVGSAIIAMKGYLDAWKNGFDWQNLIEMFGGLAAAIFGVWLAFKSNKATKRFAGLAAGTGAAIGGIAVAILALRDAWQNGIDLKNMAVYFVAMAVAAWGAYTAFGAVGAEIAMLVGGIGLIVLALKEWISTGNLTNKGLAALVVGIGLVGGALALLTGSWIPLVVAAVAALAAAVAARWEEIKDRTAKVLTSIKDFLARTLDTIKSKVSEKVQAIKDKVMSVVSTIKEKIQTVISTIKEYVGTKIQEIKSNIEEKLTAAKDKVSEAFESVRSTIQDKLTAAKTTVTSIFDSIKQSIQDKIDGARQKVKDTIDKIKGYFNFQWSLPHLKTPHLSWGTTPASGWVSDILSALGLPTSLPKLSVSWYARGGIVDGATLIGAGEAGKEAIIPLERNTQWIDNVAGRIAQLLGGGALSRELTEIARRLGEIPAALDRLGLAVTNIPMPAMASGTVIPPRALYVDGPVQGLGDMASQLKQLLTGGAGADGREANYTFIARMNGRTIFREVIAEGKLEKSRTGQNPFDLGG